MQCKRGHLGSEFGFIRPDGRRGCRECRRVTQRARRAKNPEKTRGYANSLYARNPEKFRTQTQKYYDKNPEKRKDSSHTWRGQNPEKVKAHKRRRKARKLDQLGFWPIPEPLFLGLLYEIDPHCYYCRTSLKGVYHAEHKIPLSRPEMCPAGKKLHEPWNLRLSCPSCNFRKHNKTAEEFRALLIGSRSNQ